MPTKNEHNWTEIDDLVIKTMIGRQKISDTFFWKKIKTNSIWFGQTNCLISSPIMAEVEPAHQK